MHGGRRDERVSPGTNVKYSPDQPRVPAGNSDGGQWTDAGGGEASVDLAQARGRGGNVRIGGYTFEATPAQILRLSNATNAAEAAVSRVRDIDPSWRPCPGLYESAEGAISHQIGIEAEANPRFNELRRDAIPGTSHSWGVNRLRKELYDRGYRLEKQARSEGLIFRDVFGREVRIMNRPNQRYRNDSSQKFLNEHYYRYKPGRGKPWGQHTTILDKAGS